MMDHLDHVEDKKDMIKDMDKTKKVMLIKTKKDMIKGDRQIQENFSAALIEVDDKTDRMKEVFVFFGLLFVNSLTNIRQEDTNGNFDIDGSEDGQEGDDYNDYGKAKS